jgi:hypothetical protein
MTVCVVTVDGAFLQAALENQVQVVEQVQAMIQAECRLYVTRCIYAELVAGGKFFSGASNMYVDIPPFIAHSRPLSVSPSPMLWCLPSVVAIGRQQAMLAPHFQATDSRLCA